VVRDRRFLKRLPAIDALPERQKDALITTIDGLLRHKASDPHPRARLTPTPIGATPSWSSSSSWFF
jgi:hypothetical protein